MGGIVPAHSPIGVRRKPGTGSMIRYEWDDRTDTPTLDPIYKSAGQGLIQGGQGRGRTADLPIFSRPSWTGRRAPDLGIS